MHILLITSFYPPEIRSISTMMRELAHGLAARGHDVTVVTPYARENIPDEARDIAFPEVVVEAPDVTIVRFHAATRRTTNYIARGIRELALPARYRRVIRRHVRRPIDGVIVYTPHFPLTLVGAWVRRTYGARYLLNVQDIFPQNAIDAGIMRNHALVAWYEALERRAYAQADAITTHTTGGRSFLVAAKGVAPEKISTVFNWIHVDDYDTAADGGFRHRYALDGSFVLLFAGIFGPTQGLDALLDLAQRVVDLRHVRFLFVGEGTEKARLMASAAARGLSNALFEPFVSPRDYPALLREVDVGVLCLAPSNTTAVVPGKLTGYMAAGLPVLALLQDASEGNRIIREAHCGYAVPSHDAEAAERAARSIILASPEERWAMGARGRTYAREHFAREACIDRLASLVVS